MNKLFNKIAALSVGLAMAIGVGVAIGMPNNSTAKTRAADSGIAAENGKFVIDFYDSTKLNSTSGSNLTNNNYTSFVKVYTGLTISDVVTGVTSNGTVQYGKNGGLTVGSSSANSNSVTFSVGADYKVSKLTLYAAKYENGRWKLNGNAADSGTIADAHAEFSVFTEGANPVQPYVWDNLDAGGEGITSLAFTKDNGSGSNQKRLTIYTIVCEYSTNTEPKVKSVSLDKTSIRMADKSSETVNITVTADEGAVYTLDASSSEESIVTASIDGSVLTVTSHDTFGTAVVTVTAGTKSATLQVRVADPNGLKFLQQVKSSSELVNGEQYILAAHFDSKVYVMKPVVENINTTGGSNMKCVGVELEDAWTDTFGSDTIKTARVDLNDYAYEIGVSGSNYTFKLLSGNLLGMSGDNTTMVDGGTNSNWTIGQGTLGTFRVLNTQYNTRGLGFQASTSAFGSYAAASNFIDSKADQYSEMEFYKVVELTGIPELAITCDGVGSNSANWSNLESSFNAITNVAWKSYYRHATYSKAGAGLSTVVTATNNTIDAIAQFVAKYDCIIGKYGQVQYEDFMGRNPLPIGGTPLHGTSASFKTNTIVAVAIIVSMLGAAFIGSYLLIKRRKNND